MKNKSTALMLCWLLSGCGMSATSSPTDTFVQQIAPQVGCPAFRSQLWDGLYQMAREQGAFPESSDITSHLEKAISLSHPRVQKNEVRELSHIVGEVYDLILRPPPGILKAQDRGEHIGLLAALELGDRSTPERAQLQSQIAHKLEQAQALAAPFADSCPETPSPERPLNAPSSTYFEALQKELPAPVYGARKTFATAHQTCEALSAPLLNRETPAVQGIKILAQKHPDGVGRKRVIGNLPLLLSTHPYLAHYQAPKPNACFAVLKSPLIYDYGGKPYGTEKVGTPLNLFRNFGDGTEVLGIDCSGFVAASLFAAGLKLRSDIPLKPIQASGVSSSMFKDPKGNGLDCMKKIEFSPEKTLQGGDVIAITGHVVMVDAVGSDPFGISHLQKKSDCKLANIDPSHFDFSLIQSSNSKGGIGLNRIVASEYLAGGGTMATGLKEYGVAACRARWGETSQPISSQVTVSRHDPRASCLANPVGLEHESCLDTCAPNLQN